METKSKNLLYVIDTLKVGGAQLHLVDVMAGLDPARFRPLVCTLGPETNLSRQLKGQGFTVRTLGLKNIYGSAAMRELPRLVRWIRESRVDLVHTYLPSANVYGSIAARMAGVSNVITSRRDMGFSRSWRMACLEQTLVNPLVRRVVTVCDAVSSRASRDWFLDSRKLVTIYNGVDTERLGTFDESDCSRIRDELGIPGKAPVISIVGSLTPVKAHEVLFEAAVRVLAASQPAFFIVVGDGPLRPEHERLVQALGIEQHVRFVGEVSKTRVDEILAVTDIGVLTSETEGMSNALLDFMLHQKPIVATSVGGNLEVVNHGRTGILVPPRDESALSNALLSLLEDPDKAVEMGRQGRRRIDSLFSREGMLRSLESLYESLIDAQDGQSASRAPTELAERTPK